MRGALPECRARRRARAWERLKVSAQRAYFCVCPARRAPPPNALRPTERAVTPLARACVEIHRPVTRIEGVTPLGGATRRARPAVGHNAQTKRGGRNLTCARRSRCRCEGAHGPGCRDARACVYHRRRVVLREAVGCTQRARRGSARCSNRRRLAGRPCSLPRAVPADPGARAANSARRALCACINCVTGGRFHAETRGVALPGGPRPP